MGVPADNVDELALALGPGLPRFLREDRRRRVVEDDNKSFVVAGWAKRHKVELDALAEARWGHRWGFAFGMRMLQAFYSGIAATDRGERVREGRYRVGIPTQWDDDEWERALGCSRATVHRAHNILDPTHAARERVYAIRRRVGERRFHSPSPELYAEIQAARMLTEEERDRGVVSLFYRQSRRLANVTRGHGQRLHWRKRGESKARAFVDLIPVAYPVREHDADFLVRGPALGELLRSAEMGGLGGHYLRIRRRLMGWNTRETPYAVNPFDPTLETRVEVFQAADLTEPYVGPDPPHPALAPEGLAPRQFEGHPCDCCGVPVPKSVTWCRDCHRRMDELGSWAERYEREHNQKRRA